MKPHPRIRKTIKWGGAAVTVLLVVVWIGSGWAAPGYLAPDLFGKLYPGRIWVTYGTDWTNHYPTDPWFLEWHDWSPWRWKLEWSGDRIRGMVAVLPLWIPTLASTCLTAVAWYFDTHARRRTRLGLCPKCNYDRIGILKDAVCPECGAAPTSV
jgi:hypothetical protein